MHLLKKGSQCDRPYRPGRKKRTETGKKMDKQRRAYYEYFTDAKWLDLSQYHLCIDSSRFHQTQILEILKNSL